MMKGKKKRRINLNREKSGEKQRTRYTFMVHEIILFRNLCMKFDGMVLLVIFEYQSAEGFDRSKLEPIRGNRGFFCNVY